MTAGAKRRSQWFLVVTRALTSPLLPPVLQFLSQSPGWVSACYGGPSVPRLSIQIIQYAALFAPALMAGDGGGIGPQWDVSVGP
ncbi:hypothetical protein BO71DRAFT_401063 [Aspergillus ellipticus CBS 707.79]|uniref:Uncharacterized protein n=1 Tax=Aspergillus ellipticus CBS 707.79 TaxID=1448320 RepID=A0A319D308_9EURO|nr:hypothetical protein BO71DRAFT_401063 [Aspergillus ellipticus CBS 707.79]